jgi:hypothetical protein
MSNAGRFDVDVSIGGYPVMITITYNEDYERQIRFSHSELSDLEYAVRKAMAEAERLLPANHRNEVRA